MRKVLCLLLAGALTVACGTFLHANETSASVSSDQRSGSQYKDKIIAKWDVVCLDGIWYLYIVKRKDIDYTRPINVYYRFKDGKTGKYYESGRKKEFYINIGFERPDIVEVEGDYLPDPYGY